MARDEKSLQKTTNGNRAPLAVGQRGAEIRSIESLWRFADMVAKSGLDPQGGNTAAIAVKVQTGLELGFTPMRALQSLHVVNGRVGLSAMAMKALVLRSGLAEYIVEGHEGSGDKLVGWARTKRKGHPEEVTRRFSIAQAKRAGLAGKDNWKNYPEDMVMSRAVSRLLRAVYADVLTGLYTPEELEDVKPPTEVPEYKVQNLDQAKQEFLSGEDEEPEEKPEEAADEGDSIEESDDDEILRHQAWTLLIESGHSEGEAAELLDRMSREELSDVVGKLSTMR